MRPSACCTVTIESLPNNGLTCFAVKRLQRPSMLTGLMSWAFINAMHVYGTRKGLDLTARFATAAMNSDPMTRTVPAVSCSAAAAATMEWVEMGRVRMWPEPW